jgi:catechol 2,3-dioxygenase-like lactoylglutathione lyase family enzyme
MTAVVDSFGLSRIAQIAVVIHDLPRAVAFYRDTLGMRLLFEAPPMMAFFDCAGVRLMLSLPSAPEHDHPSSIIYYAVEDIHASARTLGERGVVFEQEPHVVAKLPHADVWIGAFRDPDGNILELMSEVAPAA